MASTGKKLIARTHPNADVPTEYEYNKYLYEIAQQTVIDKNTRRLENALTNAATLEERITQMPEGLIKGERER